MGQLEGHGEANPQSVDMYSILSPQEFFLTHHLILSPTCTTKFDMITEYYGFSMIFEVSGTLPAEIKSKTVISGGARKRIGGPQVPVPRLT